MYERLKAANYVTPIPAVAPKNPSQWVNPNKSCAYHSGMKGYTIDECRSLKDKIQSLIDNKIIVVKEPSPNVCNNPLPDHKGGGVHIIEVEDDWDPEGSIRLIMEGDDPKKPTITLNQIIVQIQPSEEVEVNMSVPFEFEASLSAKTPVPIEVEFVSPANAPAPFEVAFLPLKSHVPFEVRISARILVAMSTMSPFNTNVVPWDYTAEVRRKGRVKVEEFVTAQGMTRTGRVYTLEHLAESSKQAPIGCPLLRQVLNEAYVPSNITRGEMDNMVGQVLESHKITFHKDELPPEELGHNKTLQITMQYEDYFITRILIDGGSSLNICPLVTLKKLGKGLYEIKDGAINVKVFDGSQKSTIATYNLLLGRPWIYAVGAVASTLHQDVKFEWNHQKVIIHGDGSNPIYTSQAIPVIGNRRRLGGEIYHRIEHVNEVEKNKWWSNKIESILAWS
ncbi:uncharacterized protein [Nicotiana sylvestris]|uniref:uncharacterized protein n=1 Tax=Nicotiana sylvestris TaxID=4096 RepID=UPI00388CCF06